MVAREFSKRDLLFGQQALWRAEDWVSSDDRVRGGASESHLDCSSGTKAVFYGALDTTVLGGAGFASQRTVDPNTWDFFKDASATLQFGLAQPGYDGLQILLFKGDGNKYTLNLKDEVLPRRPDGRERSSISWEYDFIGGDSELTVPWSAFKPTYRGKPQPDAAPLKLEEVKRISIMIRSFFGEQESGPFRLELDSIAAVAWRPSLTPSR